MYTFKNITNPKLEDNFLNFAVDVVVYLTPESNEAIFKAINEQQTACGQKEFESWKDYYNAFLEIFGCDIGFSHIERMENIHLFGSDEPTLCWFGANPDFGSDERYYGLMPILFSDETKTKITPVWYVNHDILFFEFSEEFAAYMNETCWHYKDYEFRELEIVKE